MNFNCLSLPTKTFSLHARNNSMCQGTFQSGESVYLQVLKVWVSGPGWFLVDLNAITSELVMQRGSTIFKGRADSVFISIPALALGLFLV